MSTNTNQAQTIVNIESLIQSHNSRLDILTKEYKEHKSMLDNILTNDNEYLKAFEDAKKTAKLKSIAKQKLLRQPEAGRLLEKIKDYQSELKELKVALSDYLSQYVTLSGQNQLEGPDGVVRQIVYTAKLVKIGK
jgi:hypothetical protein